MLDKNDKNWIVENFVTRGEFRSEMSEIKAGLARVEELSKQTLAIAEGIVGKVADLEQENNMGALTLQRHDTQIQELAAATGTALSQ